jgi:hypothetical protein
MRVTKESLLLHVREHHQRAAIVIYKATTGVNVELSNLLLFKISQNLIMWLWSYRTRSLGCFGGVGHFLVWATCWWNTLGDAALRQQNN